MPRKTLAVSSACTAPALSGGWGDPSGAPLCCEWDGVSSAALDPARERPALALEVLLDDARAGFLRLSDLFGFLASPRWNSSTVDDRSLALLWAVEENFPLNDRGGACLGVVPDAAPEHTKTESPEEKFVKIRNDEESPTLNGS